MKKYYPPIIFLTLTLLFVYVKAKSYKNYKLFNVIPKSEEDISLLKAFSKSGTAELWEENFNEGDEVKVMVSPKKQNIFINALSRNGVEFSVVFEDLEQVINNQNPKTRSNGNTTFHSLSWDRYYNLEDIYNWLDELVVAYPGIVSSYSIGSSFENRQIKGIIINYHPEREDKKFGVLEGAIHAREWITPATITWIIKEFLTSTDPKVRSLAENIEWHIFPVVNPDGYSYTFTHNRMWRKNRSTEGSKTCDEEVDDDMSNGVDLNRNFDIVWMSIGASNDSCTNLYAGPSAMSEPEARRISQNLLRLRNQGEIIYYLAFHSYTQLLLVPYSHVTGHERLTANNYADMYEIAIRSTAKLEERYGTKYSVGVSSDVMYAMSGTSFDWAKYYGEAKISLLFELRDEGQYGFLLPADQIIPNCQEVMDALVEMDRTTKNLRYYRSSATDLQFMTHLIFLIFVFII